MLTNGQEGLLCVAAHLLLDGRLDVLRVVVPVLREHALQVLLAARDEDPVEHVLVRAHDGAHARLSTQGRERERNVLFNDALNTFYPRLYGVRHMVKRERNVLFNDALNTFYLRLYGVRHMVKDHSDSEKGNPLPPHIGYSYRLTARVLLYAHHPTDRITHTTAFVTPVVEYWLEREIAQWVHPMKDRSDDPSHHACQHRVKLNLNSIVSMVCDLIH